MAYEAGTPTKPGGTPPRKVTPPPLGRTGGKPITTSTKPVLQRNGVNIAAKPGSAKKPSASDLARDKAMANRPRQAPAPKPTTLSPARAANEHTNRPGSPTSIAAAKRLANRPRYSCPLHIGSSIAPHIDTAAAEQRRTGNIMPLQSENVPDPSYWNTRWAYKFLFNPQTLSIGTALNPELTPDAPFDRMAVFSGQQTFALELNLDRQLEVAGVPVPGAQHPDLPMVRKMGCGYDVEYIYRVINGDPRPGAVNAQGYPTSDTGFFFMTMVLIDLGGFKFTGYINELRVDHKMFALGMIPTVSTMTLGVTRLTFDQAPSTLTSTGTTTYTAPGGATAQRPPGAQGGPQA